MTNKVVLWGGAALGALLIVAIIVGIVLITTINKQTEREAYQDCLARHGHAADAPPPNVPEDELDAYLESMVDAAEACTR